MFIVCEPVVLGMEHVPFNAALLKTICSAFPTNKVCFYSEKNHLKFIREEIGEELEASILWKELSLPPRKSNFFSRLPTDFKTVKFLLDKLNNNPQKDVLVITGISSILWALKYYTKTLHKNKKVQVVIHGDFSTLERTPLRSILNPCYYIGSLKTALRLPGYDRIQHIVLEEPVRNAIIKHMPFLRNSIYVFEHPIPVDGGHKPTDRVNPPLDIPVQFGYLGRATQKKGFSKYLDVASEISAQFPGQANFHFIGRVSDKFRYKNRSKMAFLTEVPGKERLSRAEYVDRLKCLHYVCLFYSDFYEFCASGILMDSIAWEKPIIATKLKMFKNLQEKFGDIGYVCSKNEIAETIKAILRQKDSNRYKRQVLNMRRVKTSRTPETLAGQYTELVRLLRPVP